MPVKWSKKSGEGMKVEKDEFLIDSRKSAMMTMRRRPLTDHQTIPDLSPVPDMIYNVFVGTLSLTQSINQSRLELQQLESYCANWRYLL